MSRRSRTCTRADTRTYLPLSSGRCSPPGSNPGTAGRGCCIFLAMEITKRRLASTNFLLGLMGLALPLLHGLDDAAVVRDLNARFRSQRVNVGANLVDLLALVPDELHPCLVAGRRHAFEPQVWSGPLPKYSSMKCRRGTPKVSANCIRRLS